MKAITRSLRWHVSGQLRWVHASLRKLGLALSKAQMFYDIINWIPLLSLLKCDMWMYVFFRAHVACSCSTGDRQWNKLQLHPLENFGRVLYALGWRYANVFVSLVYVKYLSHQISELAIHMVIIIVSIAAVGIFVVLLILCHSSGSRWD